MALSSLPPDVLSQLAITVVRQASGRTARERTSILSLCAEAVEFGREAAGADAALRARAASRLLLELAYPELGQEQLQQLSLACEKAVHHLA